MKKFRGNWMKRVRRTRKPLSQNRPWHRWADDDAAMENWKEMNNGE